MAKTETDAEKLLGFILLVIFFFPLVLWRAYAIYIIYGWYAPPSWPEVTMRVVVGLVFVVGLLTSTKPRDPEKTALEVFFDALVAAIVYPLMSLLFARIMLWIV